MPITNLAIAKRRLLELQEIVGPQAKQRDLAECNLFDFRTRVLRADLVRNLEDAKFYIWGVVLDGTELEVTVLSETPEKIGCKVRSGLGV